ncbi:hypothetical protein Noda2021_04520 [Candidatus Dependentiae bacterium Noda2021]|nr:hypothetical protein Noda2021_04520 [Candidatus Dependentiae bacterium Noda2021]
MYQQLLVLLITLNTTMLCAMQSVRYFIKQTQKATNTRNYCTQRKPSYGFLWTPYQNTLFAAASIPVQKYESDSIEHYINERYLQKVKRIPLAGIIARSAQKGVEKSALLEWLRIQSYGVAHNNEESPVNAEGITTHLVTCAAVNCANEIEQWPLVCVQHWQQPVFIMSDEPLEVSQKITANYDAKQVSTPYYRHVIHPFAVGVSLKEYYRFLDNLNPRLSRVYSSLTHQEALIIRAACQKILINALIPNTFDHALQEITNK